MTPTAMHIPPSLMKGDSEGVRVVSPCEAAAILHVSPCSIYRALERHTLPGIRWSASKGLGHGPWRMGRSGSRWAQAEELKSLFGA